MDKTGLEEYVEDEEAPKRDPQVNSSDPLERKLARRLRIQKRLETMKKQRGDVQQTEEGGEEPKEPLDQQIIDSVANLESLIQDGQEQVSNVRVASDAREVKRRKDQEAARAARLKMVEDEAKESLKKLEEINVKWNQISHYKDPLNIYSEMEAQKVKCEELLQRKNEVIEKLNKELDKSDEQFRRDQKRQKEDLNLLAERIDNHIEMMKKAYRQELAMLDEVIKAEHSELVEVTNKEWEELYKEREKEEVVNLEKKFELILDYEKEMDTIHIEHHEKFREAKIRLESDIRILQQELEKIKALCLLNSEKLDYNFLILKKRDAENIIMKAHQKRRINKLQDVVNKLKAKIEDAEKTTQSEKQRLTDEILKLHNNIIDIGHKADIFAEVNDKRYNQVWEMNEAIAKELLDKILTADRIIHEQQLGIPWQPPDLRIMTRNDLPSYLSAMKAVEKVMKQKAICNSPKEPDTQIPEELAAIKSKGDLLRHILNKIADSSGFLMEEKIFPLLFPYKKTEKTLIKIENIFKALGVQTEDDIQLLKEYFIPYVSCEICGYSPSREPSLESLSEEEEQQQQQQQQQKQDQQQKEKTASFKSSEEDQEVDLFISLHRGMSHLSTMTSPENISLDSEEKVEKKEGKDETRSTELGEIPDSVRETKIDFETIKQIGGAYGKHMCEPSHPLKVDPIYVLKALRAFVADLSKRREVVVEVMSDRLAKERRTVSRSLKYEDVKSYWERFTQIFSPEREKLWDALLIGLHKYLEILQTRHKLNEEVQSLRQQNEELKKLVHQYVMTFGQGMKRSLPPIKSAKQKHDMCR